MFGLYLLPKGFRKRTLTYKFKSLNYSDESYMQYTYKKLFNRFYLLVRTTYVLG